MELILKSSNEQSIAKVLALAKKLNMSVERREVSADDKERKALKTRILKFKAKSENPFGDAAEWERNEREDRELPFS
ncbi:hypothetical protein GCM10007415_45310 [Parapedobacter pyrenivorans]|uniref:Uncharacterized protein n=1 Tax=Parapedobacter pyrenivorans TaxID=1305674 RepID=A0A917I2Z6_9SPHI|nr:hypothetical protein [Parapedobacter pyrenivorans]GGH04050.1 hypothetical protein GCM10007415_45310 [Parapedobacter pyrenivorans]